MERSVYLRNLETNGEFSPLRMKCPDGPSPRNSENHDSCSISSLRIAWDRSYVRWSFPAVMLQMCVYPRTAHLSASTSTVSIALVFFGFFGSLAGGQAEVSWKAFMSSGSLPPSSYIRGTRASKWLRSSTRAASAISLIPSPSSPIRLHLRMV